MRYSNEFLFVLDSVLDEIQEVDTPHKERLFVALCLGESAVSTEHVDGRMKIQ